MQLAPAGVGFDPLRDKRYRETALGRDVVDFLAWLELGGAAEKTLDQYERDLARGCLMFPTKDIAHLEDGDAIQIARQFKPRERRTRVAAWRSFYKWGLRSRRCERNPFDALPQIKRAPRRVFDLFTDPEITALCGLELRDAALMQILFDAGPRKGDCRNFQLQHHRVEATPDAPYGMLVFREGKGGKDRQVPATPAVAAKLHELALLDGLQRTDHLWYTRPANAVGHRIKRDRPIGDGSFDRWWRRCLEQAGVRYRNPHTTRHTFATRYLRGLGSKPGRLETLQLVLGHESIRTTSDLYGHLDMSDVALDMGLVPG